MSEGRNGFSSRVLIIAKNAFREAVRDRILYNLVLFVLLIMASAIFLSELSAGQEARVIVNLGLGATLLIGSFVAIFVGVSLVWKEIEKRTVYSIFSKPVSRSQFIVGKYIGLCLTLLVNIAIMGTGLSLTLLFVHGQQFAIAIWPAVLLIYLELTILTGVAIMFSSFSTPALSALLTFFVFIIGHFSASLRLLSSEMETNGPRLLFDAVYYLLPALSHFSFATETANGLAAPPEMLAGAAAYAVVYDIILLMITVLIFSRRNFK